jgi:hypothetical protein
MNTFESVPGGTARTAWPQLSASMQTTARRRWPTRLHNNRSNGCGIAVTNFCFASALLIQPGIVIRRGEYMHVGPQVAGVITQFNVTADPPSGVSTYKFRTYLRASH